MNTRYVLFAGLLTSSVFAQDLTEPPPTKDAAPEAAPTKEKKDVRASAGYSYSDPKPTGKRVFVRKTTSVSASYPTLSLADGHSRLSVRLSKTATVEEKKAQGEITYVIKGAHIVHWNDTHPLVAVHFNTPVSVAALHPHKGDVEFKVQLRADAAPTYKVEQQAEGAMLTIDFPAGEFLKSPAPAAP